jgi:putative MATE family efflux protein
MGAGVVIARFFGAKDYKKVKTAIHTDLAFGVACGIALTIIGVVFAPQILRLMSTPDNVFGEAVWYIRVYFCGSLAVVLYNVCTGILQAVGDSRHPLYYLIISSVVNLVLDIIFNGVLRLGVGYSALATIISQFLSVLLCMRRLITTQDVYQVNLREIRFDIPILKQIISVGLPSGIQNSIISVANVVIQSNVNAFGDNAMAGCGAYWKIEGFGFLPITCFSMAMTTFIGQNLGAKQYDRAKKGSRFGIICSITMAELIGIAIFMFIPQLVRLFNTDPAVVEYGSIHAHTVCLFYFLLAYTHTIAGVLRGAGKSVVPMYVMLAVWCIFRIAYVTSITHFLPGIRPVLAAYPITWAISSVILLVYFLKADWIHSFEK